MSRRRSSADVFFGALLASAALFTAVGAAPTPSTFDAFARSVPADMKVPGPRVTPVFTPSPPVTLFTDPFGNPTVHGAAQLAKRGRYNPPLTKQGCLCVLAGSYPARSR